MNIHKLATSRSLFVILLLIVAMLMSSIAFCQTATKQFPKIVTTAQVPAEPGSKEDDEVIKLLLEENRRLKEENTRLKAEIETLKQNK